jgi:hypothetical protein
MNSKKEVFLIGRQKSEALSVFVFKQVSFMLPVFFLLNDEPVAKELHQRIAIKYRLQILRSKNSLIFFGDPRLIEWPLWLVSACGEGRKPTHKDNITYP